MKSNNAHILDMTAGSRMMWFNKHNPLAIFVDKRSEVISFKDKDVPGGVRRVKVKPDIVADWTKGLPFDDNSFKLVVFDPPHLIHAGPHSWLRAKYGVLNKDTYQDDLAKGFEEAMRVLQPYGVLVFKWSNEQIMMKDALSKVKPGIEPLFGSRRGKTLFITFMKTDEV